MMRSFIASVLALPLIPLAVNAHLSKKRLNYADPNFSSMICLSCKITDFSVYQNKHEPEAL